MSTKLEFGNSEHIKLLKDFERKKEKNKRLMPQWQKLPDCRHCDGFGLCECCDDGCAICDGSGKYPKSAYQFLKKHPGFTPE